MVLMNSFKDPHSRFFKRMTLAPFAFQPLVLLLFYLFFNCDEVFTITYGCVVVSGKALLMLVQWGGACIFEQCC